MSESIEESLYDTPPTRGAKAQVPEDGPPPLPDQSDEPSPEEHVMEPRAKREFDPRYRERLQGLLYLGHLEDSFTYAGHQFRVRNLTAGETIEAGVLIKSALGTRVELKAWSSAVAAAGIISVDGQPLIVPLMAGAEPSLEEKYRLILKWYEPIVQRVYDAVTALEEEARRMVDALGEAGGQGN